MRIEIDCGKAKPIMVTQKNTAKLLYAAAALLWFGGCQPFFGIIPTPKEFKMKKSVIPPKAETLSKSGERYLMIKHLLKLSKDSNGEMPLIEKNHVQIQSLTWKSTQSRRITQGAIRFTPRRKLQSIYARIIRPNGWVTPARGFFNWPYNWSPSQQSNSTWQLWFLGNITPGAVHEYLATYKSAFVHYTFMMQQSNPNNKAELRFEAPNGYGFHARVYGGQKYAAGRIKYRTEASKTPGRTVHVWTATNLPAFEKEAGQPATRSLSARVEISPKNIRYNGKSYPNNNWKDVAAFEQAMFADASKSTPKIKSFTQKLLKEKGVANGTKRQKAKAIIEFLHGSEFRFLPRIGEPNNFSVTSAETTFKRRWGNDRANAALGKAMLKSAGVPAHIVRIRTRDKGPLDRKLPSPAVFNHTILHVPGVGYIDSSAPQSVFDQLELKAQGAPALNIDTKSLEQTPQTSLKDIRQRRATMDVTPDGKVKGKFELTLKGRQVLPYETALAKHYLDTKAQKKRWVQGQLGYLGKKRLLSAIKVESYSIKTIGEHAVQILADFTGKLHKGSTTKCQVRVQYDSHDEFQSFLKEERKGDLPLLWNKPGNYIDQININGLAVLDVPKPLKFKEPFMSYNFAATKAGNSSQLKTVYQFNKMYLTNAEYKKMQERLVQINEAENYILTLSTMKPGCPGGDQDGDGIPDDKDKCPKVKGIPENQGCPDKDSDGDKIVDRLDKCPDVPGIPEKQGCPKVVLVKVTGKKIEILQKIFFRLNKASIRKKSFPVLDQVASVLLSHPHIHVSIEGHTDSSGNPKYNVSLSDRRAKSVKAYLVKKGVKADHLKAKGFGPNKPIADNKTRKGRADNRRVEFNIIEHDDDKNKDKKTEIKTK